MKKFTVFYLAVFTVARLYSQSYEINFAGTGDTTVVDSVKVENLKHGTTLILKGDEVLKLNLIPSGINNNAYETKPLQVYPNPMTEEALILFFIKESSNVLVEVYDLSGRSVVQSNMFLHPGKHTYSITGLNQGMYIVRVNDQNSVYTAKLISRNMLKGDKEIVYLSSYNMSLEQTGNIQLKSTSSAIDMEYREGERLKLTGMAGNYSTVVTDKPSGDTTIKFDFIECKDADHNHYPVVAIGTQTWMAENLATTKYNDGSAIPQVSDSTSWSILSTPACCWYDNDSATNKSIYGALYNWFAVDTASNGDKNVCPSGWHVPTDDEWTVLSAYIGSNADRLKETGTTHWYPPNTGASNMTGFTAIGAGWRSKKSLFLHLNMYGVIWSTTEYNTSNALYREIYYDNSTFFKYDWDKESGFSVRCVKD